MRDRSTKYAKKKTIRIAWVTLPVMVYYLHRTWFAPAPFLVHHCNNLALCTGKERIAKIALGIMDNVVLDVDTFKAHPMCGSTTTELLSEGTERTLVQAHGF